MTPTVVGSVHLPRLSCVHLENLGVWVLCPLPYTKWYLDPTDDESDSGENGICPSGRHLPPLPLFPFDEIWVPSSVPIFYPIDLPAFFPFCVFY